MMFKGHPYLNKMSCFINHHQNPQLFYLISQKYKVFNFLDLQLLGLVLNDPAIYNPINMHVYEMSSTNQQYAKTKYIPLKSGNLFCEDFFPQQYINLKCLIVNKNGNHVNLIRKNQNPDFIAHQSIDFGHRFLMGQMSEDEEYLITWDDKSKEIKIRKYHQE
ncbi:unnamed protein product [Paramecium octaurelia]|uniref:Uncharacterized protein n=1 Tax=Paramecium octaurelia TaxID=43137 RepID=A0A8S1YLU5_PAROT|nr:unnamed protein product [Paramecium octaurelia]